MGIDTIVTSFTYSATSTADIVLSGWGFQPKGLIMTWSGAASATNAVGAGDVKAGRGFGTGVSDQRSAGYCSTDGASVGAGATWHRDDAIISVVNDDATEDGHISIKSIDAGGVTLQVDSSISIGLTVMVVGFGGTDITNIATGQDTDNTTTGNKSNTGIGFQPDIMFFVACADGNNSPTGGSGSNSEAGFETGVMTSSAQYTMAMLTDDGSANADTGGYIYNGEFLASCQTSNPLNIWARKTYVSFDTNGFTWNQLETAQTSGCYFHFLAIKGGNWAIGDFTTQTDTTTTVTESGLSFAPDLIGFESISKALSTQDTGNAQCNGSFGAATSSNQMAVAFQDEDSVATTSCSNAVNYDNSYLNISTSDAIQGSGQVTAWNSDGFDFKMTDADPGNYYTFWWSVGTVPAAGSTYPGWIGSGW